MVLCRGRSHLPRALRLLHRGAGMPCRCGGATSFPNNCKHFPLPKSLSVPVFRSRIYWATIPLFSHAALTLKDSREMAMTVVLSRLTAQLSAAELLFFFCFFPPVQGVFDRRCSPRITRQSSLPSEWEGQRGVECRVADTAREVPTNRCADPTTRRAPTQHCEDDHPEPSV